MAIKSIILQNSSNREQSFEIAHALRILRLKKTAWKIPEDSQFELTKNGFRKKPNPKLTGEDTKEGINTKRNRASKQA